MTKHLQNGVAGLASLLAKTYERQDAAKPTGLPLSGTATRTNPAVALAMSGKIHARQVGEVSELVGNVLNTARCKACGGPLNYEGRARRFACSKNKLHIAAPELNLRLAATVPGSASAKLNRDYNAMLNREYAAYVRSKAGG